MTEKIIIQFFEKLITQTDKRQIKWFSRDGCYRTVILEKNFRLSVFKGHIKLSMLDKNDFSLYDFIRPQSELTELHVSVKRQINKVEKSLCDWMETYLSKSNSFR